MSVDDGTVCRPEPIRDAKAERAVAVLRQSRDARFVGGGPRLPRLLDPVTMYRVAFGREPDEQVARRVLRAFQREVRDIARGEQDDEPGYVYCFHELSDAPDVLKLGRTARTPEERLGEWERELSPDEGRSVILLFAHRTRCNVFAERIVHETLRCERIANRLNPVTGDELEEFFRLDNVMAVSVFVRQVLAYVDRWCDGAYARARRSAARPQRGKRRR